MHTIAGRLSKQDRRETKEERKQMIEGLRRATLSCSGSCASALGTMCDTLPATAGAMLHALAVHLALVLLHQKGDNNQLFARRLRQRKSTPPNRAVEKER